MNKEFNVSGNKGGEKKQRTPVEKPDDLHSVARVKLLLALGEGEFQSTPTAKDIYLDDTPIQSRSGEINYPTVTWDYRSGSVDQSYIKGMPSVENEFPLNYELTNTNVYVRAVTDRTLSALRVRVRWPFLQQTKSNGDRVGTSVQYKIEISTDGGPYVEMVNTSVTGKTTSGYERTHRVDLPTSTSSGWQLRVTKITPDSTSDQLLNTMFVVGVTEVIDVKLKYPNTALLFVEFDSETFQNTPKVSVRVKGRSWPVPTNYDPVTRIYSGNWDGTFKQAWTNNPVWIAYGLMTHERFGLGKRIKANMVDKWEMYRISQYCDELVSDGKGGLEPRFTCNMYIQSRAEAWTVLRDVAAIYRGMTYWSQSQMTTLADMPRDIDYNFTRSNVIDGRFTYSGGSERDIYTRALVSYDDPTNMYETNTTVVNDYNLQRRYGDNVIELSAIGCTSESEAQRRGAWVIYTNSKNRTVSFQTGLEGATIKCGHIIGVADSLLSGRQMGGRVAKVVSAKSFELDRETSAQIGDLLYLNLPSGKSQARTINSVSQNGRVITVGTNFTETPQEECQFTIEASDLVVQQYRVTKITKDDDHLYTIEGVYFDPDKYAQIDGKAKREDRPISVIPAGVQSPPTNVLITSSESVDQTMSITTVRVTWTAPENAVYYTAEWRRDDGEWVRLPYVTSNSFEIRGAYSGSYLVKVRAYNAIGVASIPAQSVLTTISGKTTLPPVPVNLTTTSIIFGITLKWNFPTGALDTNYTEIQYNTSASATGATLLGMYAYPLNTHTLNGLAAGVQYYFRARLVDKSGNVGAWTSWVVGKSSDQATEILDYLTGEIGLSQLDTYLRQEIDKIGDVDLTELEASIEDERTARVNGDNALAQQITTVQATANGASTAAQSALTSVSNLDGELSSMWTVKLQMNSGGQYQFAGVGLGIENTGGVVQSNFVIRADRFAILNDNDNGTTTSPFAVSGGQTFINSAIIQDASINFAKISDSIQSSNYVADSTGWKLWKSGDFEINSSIAGGTARVVINNKGLKVIETSTNIVRIEIGELS